MDLIGMQMKAIWAKKSNNEYDKQWLPLITHMSDAAETAELLWHKWLPSCTKRRIAQGLNLMPPNASDLDDAALPCFVALAAGHDLGKAIPAFQGRFRGTDSDYQLRQQLIDTGLTLPDLIHPKIARHYWASQLILEQHGFDSKLAVVLGSHHGKPPDYVQLETLKEYHTDMGKKKGQEDWLILQKELLAYALSLAGVSEQEAKAWQPDIAAQVLLSGLVIMVDWIISNEYYFPYIELNELAPAERAETAWEEMDLPQCWNPDNSWQHLGEELYHNRFGILEPRPIQTDILKLLEKVSAPGIVIIEAPMGEGKTEAALVAAEILANKTKRSGVFFALPTQATANGLFPRLCKWINNLKDDIGHTVELIHGKANLNKLYNEIRIATKEMGGFWVGGEENEQTSDDAIIVHEWFSGRKKGMLADFVMGTIDQVLMGGLKQKHLALRHLGLANKVIILDECHAYDVYMSQYLSKVLKWLGAYGVPVVVLSATLPGHKRKQLIDAYLNEEIVSEKKYDPLFDNHKPEPLILPEWSTTKDYPVITFTDGNKVQQKKVCGKQRYLSVELQTIPDDEQIASILKNILTDGGNAGIIVNTVRRAQKIAFELSSVFGQEYVELLHSRFIAMERAHKEKELFSKLGIGGGRPQFSITVGTQVFEQSCDLDFDVLITDICPMDLLIQRIGRLHRHERPRPNKLLQAKCYITGMEDSGFERGAEAVYGKYLLMNTRALLSSQIKLPDDIPDLVQQAYQSGGIIVPEELQAEYAAAKEEQEQRIKKMIAKAQTFQICDPDKGLDNLVGWLDTNVTDDPSGKRAEASVRDIEESLEVLVVQRRSDEYFMLPWLPEFSGEKIPLDVVPDAELARAMAECSIQLPRELCWRLNQTIEALEEIALHGLRVWQQSPWLKGELFLVLDEQYSAELCGVHLQYDQNYGLLSRRINEEGENAGEGI